MQNIKITPERGAIPPKAHDNKTDLIRKMLDGEFTYIQTDIIDDKNTREKMRSSFISTARYIGRSKDVSTRVTADNRIVMFPRKTKARS